jgi:hypothetical protein
LALWKAFQTFDDGSVHTSSSTAGDGIQRDRRAAAETKPVSTRLPIHRAKKPRNSPGDNIALLMSGSIPFQKTVVLKHLFQGKNWSPVAL